MPDDLLTLAPPPADLRLPYGPDSRQFGDLRFAQGNAQGAIIMNIHGGFWRNSYDLAHAGHFCAALSAAGFATWNIEYRRVGDEGGGWPGSLEDVRQAWHFIPQLAGTYELPTKDAILIGHSAGAHLALCLAAYERSVRRVVSLAGIVDLQGAWELHLSGNAAGQFLGGSPEEIPHHYASADPVNLPIPQAEQWIIHGTQDNVVPVDFGRFYGERKRNRGEDVALLEISKADHFDLIDPRSAAWPTVESAILRLLSRPQKRLGSFS
jgi:acetyl esterase/lipase